MSRPWELTDAELGAQLAEVLDQAIDAEYGLGPWPRNTTGPLLLEARRRGWLPPRRTESSSEKRNERGGVHVSTG